MRVACIWFQKDISIDEIAHFCWKLSPRVSVRKKRALFIEVGPCINLYDELDFINSINNYLKQINQPASVAIGDSIFSALLKARFNNPDVDVIPLGGLMDVVDPFDQDSSLQKHTQKMILTFQDLGVLTLGQFKKLPTAELASRSGTLGILCLQRLQNDSQIPWSYWTPEKSKAAPQPDKLASLPGYTVATHSPSQPLYLLKPLPIEVSVDTVKVGKESYKISKWNEYTEKLTGGWNEKGRFIQQCTYDRDYYQVEVEDGTQFTIFETAERKFFLQGYSG